MAYEIPFMTVYSGIDQIAFVTWQGPGTGNPNASTSPSFTPGVGDLILVGGVVGANDDLSLPTSSSGATLSPLGGSTTNAGFAAWWSTIATSSASQTISINHSLNAVGNYQYGMFVWVLRGVGSLGTPVTNYVASGQATTVTVPSTAASSLVFALGWDYTSWTGSWTPGAESTNFLGGSVAYNDSAGDTLWAQRLTGVSPGGNITLTGDLGVGGQEWGVAAIEIRPPILPHSGYWPDDQRPKLSNRYWFTPDIRTSHRMRILPLHWSGKRLSKYRVV